MLSRVFGVITLAWCIVRAASSWAKWGSGLTKVEDLRSCAVGSEPPKTKPSLLLLLSASAISAAAITDLLDARLLDSGGTIRWLSAVGACAGAVPIRFSTSSFPATVELAPRTTSCTLRSDGVASAFVLLDNVSLFGFGLGTDGAGLTLDNCSKRARRFATDAPSSSGSVIVEAVTARGSVSWSCAADSAQ